MTEVQKSMALFSGSVNPELAEEIAKDLNVSLGNVKPGKVKKVTQGGGLLKAYEPSGKYLIAVVDPTSKVEELDEDESFELM